MDHVLGRMSEISGSEVSFGAVRITDLEFVDEAVIFVETTEVISEAHESLMRKPCRWDYESSASSPRSVQSVTSWMPILCAGSSGFAILLRDLDAYQRALCHFIES